LEINFDGSVDSASKDAVAGFMVGNYLIALVASGFMFIESVNVLSSEPRAVWEALKCSLPC